MQRQKELTQLNFNPVLWRQLSPIARATLAHSAHTTLDLDYDQQITAIPTSHDNGSSPNHSAPSGQQP